MSAESSARYPDYGVLKSTQPTSVPPTEGSIAYRINELRDANGLLHDMASQTEQLANRIAGSRPEKDEPQKPAPLNVIWLCSKHHVLEHNPETVG